MNAVLWICFELIMCVIETVLFHIYLTQYGEQRFEAKWMKYLVIFLISTAIYCKGFMKLGVGMTALIGFLILVVYAVSMYRLKFFQYIVLTLIFLGTLMMVDVLTIFLYQAISDTQFVNDTKTIAMSRFICAVTSKVLLLAIGMMLCRKKMGIANLSNHSRRLLLTTTLISMTILGCIFNCNAESYSSLSSMQDLYFCGGALGVCVINVLVYFIIMELNEWHQKEQTMQLVQCQNAMLEKTILENKAMEKEWRKNRHDFNNHLSCIDMLLQMENIKKARAYIQNLTQNFLQSAGNIRVGNEIAEAVINQKWYLAMKDHISVTVEGSIPEKLAIEQVDLCALLSNSIDNAIEAAIKVEKEEDRSISLNFRTFNKYLIIEVDNTTINESIDDHIETLKTTKVDQKHHGIGMTSMMMTTEKYNGHMEWKCKDYHFHLTLLLPILVETPVNS